MSTLHSYEFTLICTGSGRNVEEAFANLLSQLKEDPEEAITNEVVYVLKKPCILDKSTSSEFDNN